MIGVFDVGYGEESALVGGLTIAGVRERGSDE
jgi:hypothetical protein